MSVVESRQTVTRRLEFVIKGRGWGENSAVVGDVEEAIMLAKAMYEQMVNGSTDTDDWLNVTWGDDELKFWFEVDEKLAQKIDARIEEAVAAGMIEIGGEK